MRLQITHRTTYTYQPQAQGIALRLKLFPSDFNGQQVTDWAVRIAEEDVTPLHTDGFGDRVGLWLNRTPTETIEIVAEGFVETEDKVGVVDGLPRRPRPGVFLRDTDLTKPNDALRALGDRAKRNQTLDTLHALMADVRSAIVYTTGVTGPTTTASDALDGGKGVCQDQSHVFIAAARSLGIPARYITGYLAAADDDDALFETHAWAEAYIDHLGWVGFDSTNGCCPDARYVRLCTGLDADHAAPIAGSVFGDAAVSLEAHVAMSDAGQQ